MHLAFVDLGLVTFGMYRQAMIRYSLNISTVFGAYGRDFSRGWRMRHRHTAEPC
jgi:hypothetical protein